MKRNWFGTVIFLGALIGLVGTNGMRPAARVGAAPASQEAPVIVTTPTVAPPSRLPTPTPTAAAAQAPDRAPAFDASAPDGFVRVKPNDTLLTLAVELNLDLADAHCLVTPDFNAAQPLVIGELLALLPASQSCHAIQAGETLEGIARRYGTTAAALRAIDWNGVPAELSDITVLPPGGYLRVPRPIPTTPADETTEPLLPMILRQPVGTTAAQLRSLDTALLAQGARPVGGASRSAATLAPVPADWPYGSGAFAWPLYGWLTQDYHGEHRAIDVAAPTGTLVTAADRGRVIRAGWSDQGYGNLVIIDHNIDYVTVYAHLADVLVEEGQIVGQGTPIGRVGSTGNSTGPHLHFEIRDFGRRVDPVGLLLQ